MSEFDALLDAIGAMNTKGLHNFVFTLPNIEQGSEEIKRKLEKFCLSSENFYLFSSLGSLRYLSLVRESCAVIGNSLME